MKITRGQGSAYGTATALARDLVVVDARPVRAWGTVRPLRRPMHWRAEWRRWATTGSSPPAVAQLAPAGPSRTTPTGRTLGNFLIADTPAGPCPACGRDGRTSGRTGGLARSGCTLPPPPPPSPNAPGAPAFLHGTGPADPDLARDPAAAAARSGRSTWCVTVTDGQGHAIGRGCARPAPASGREHHGKPDKPDTAGAGPGRPGQPSFAFGPADQPGPPGGYGNRLKQDPRWTAEQLPSGEVRWTTPSGRQYVTEPTRYPI